MSFVEWASDIGSHPIPGPKFHFFFFLCVRKEQDFDELKKHFLVLSKQSYKLVEIMEVKQISPRQLIVENRPFLEQLIPLAVAGAGLMLILGSIKEYGPQSYYRFTYVFGALMVFWGALYLLVGPKMSKVFLDLDTGKMEVTHKQGIRMLVKRFISIHAIEQIRIEERRKKRARKPSYRLAVKLEEEWVPITHWAAKDLNTYQEAASRLQGFVGASKKEL